MKIKLLLQTMRGPFLVLTPVCIFLGASIGKTNDMPFCSLPPILALLGGLLAHIGVNTLNEYYDFKSGLDFNTKRTKFSGGSGALPQHPELAHAVLTTGVTALLIIFAIGGYFIWYSGIIIIPIGILGLFIIMTYTQWLNKSPFACLLAPGVGFGLLMVLGTHVVLGHTVTITSWLAALVPFFLVNNLLLLNQYPDLEADRSVGRRHLIIAYGIKTGNKVYAIFALAVVVDIVAAVLLGHFPMLSLLALLPMPLACFTLFGAVKHGTSIGQHPQYLGANVAVTLLTTSLLAIAFIATR
jgi:1,4-dihydroxy-2-naphthoate octaprenyltransferase